jgi:hypothetical protein
VPFGGLAMRHVHGESLGGPLQKSQSTEWDWSKNGGGYNAHRDFFSVHWEVQDRDPNSIRLHVESPKYEVDSFLNDLKQEVVNAIFASDLAQVVQRSGYQYKRGSKVSSSAVQNFKSTEPFRVVLTDEQRKLTTEQDIALVHNVIGPHVNQIVRRFTDRLKQHFQS